ncbi:MAG: type II toxin-antitoxin system Phd/YefM family antitoxin [Bacteroidota bacterium]|nr:type II toxin-antitoxin system Phd/YefM family antitoxin [Bacteroidota bacterium]
MNTYSVTKAKKNLERLLEQSKKKGIVKIKREDGRIFVLKPENNNSSPLEVDGIDLKIDTDEIIKIIRESRKR